MGKQVQKILDELIKAFSLFDNKVMEAIIINDVFINQKELELHDKVTILISTQQPVATDLRKLIVVLKISSDLERVADLAVDIAKQSKRLIKECLIPYQDKLLTMFVLAQDMIQRSLHSFELSDLLYAQKIAVLDDKVDFLYGELIKDLFNTSKQHGIEVGQVTQLAFIGRYIERIADYATNLAEWVIYEVNGKHFDLN